MKDVDLWLVEGGNVNSRLLGSAKGWVQTLEGKHKLTEEV